MIEVLEKYLDKETIIDMLPFILMDIRDYTNQYFLTKYNLEIIRIEDGKIYYDGDISNFYVGDVVELLNSYNNTILYTIKEITNDYIEVDQEIDDEIDDITLIKLSFKGINPKTLVAMIEHDPKKSGVKAETLGGYAIEYNVNNMFYPPEILSGLSGLRKLNDDFEEYGRYGYDRIQ